MKKNCSMSQLQLTIFFSPRKHPQGDNFCSLPQLRLPNTRRQRYIWHHKKLILRWIFLMHDVIVASNMIWYYNLIFRRQPSYYRWYLGTVPKPVHDTAGGLEHLTKCCQRNLPRIKRNKKGNLIQLDVYVGWRNKTVSVSRIFHLSSIAWCTKKFWVITNDPPLL